MESEGKAIKEIEKQLSIDSNVIRYLTVKYDELDLKNEYFGNKKQTVWEEIKKIKKVKNLAPKTD